MVLGIVALGVCGSLILGSAIFALFRYKPGPSENEKKRRLELEKLEKRRQDCSKQLLENENVSEPTHLKRCMNEIDEEKKIISERHNQERELERARKQKIGMNDENTYNIAICGLSGSGKSTFINSVRGRRANDNDAAKIQTGVECTQEVGQYMLNDYVALWDMPGAFTEAHPAKTYCAKLCLDLFDCIVMCYTGRWCEINTVIAQYAIDHKIPMILVYTNTKHCVDNEARDAGVSKRDAFLNLIARVRKNLRASTNHLNTSERQHHPLHFIESCSLLPKEVKQFHERHLLEALVRCSARRNPDGLTADQLWDDVKHHFLPVLDPDL